MSVKLFPGTAGVPPAFVDANQPRVSNSSDVSELVAGCGRDARGPREELDAHQSSLSS